MAILIPLKSSDFNLRKILKDVLEGGTEGQVLTADADGNAAWGSVDDQTTRLVQVLLQDFDTELATGNGVADFRWMAPEELDGWNLTSAHAACDGGHTGGTVTVQIHNVTDSVDMLSTRITIDSTETTSYTAATAPAINTSNDDLDTGDLLRFDLDAVGSSANSQRPHCANDVPETVMAIAKGNTSTGTGGGWSDTLTHNLSASRATNPRRGLVLFLSTNDIGNNHAAVFDVEIGGSNVGSLVVQQDSWAGPPSATISAAIWFIPDADLPAASGNVSITIKYGQSMSRAVFGAVDFTDIAQTGAHSTDTDTDASADNVTLTGDADAPGTAAVVGVSAGSTDATGFTLGATAFTEWLDLADGTQRSAAAWDVTTVGQTYSETYTAQGESDISDICGVFASWLELLGSAFIPHVTVF